MNLLKNISGSLRNCCQSWNFRRTCGSHYWYSCILEDLCTLSSLHAHGRLFTTQRLEICQQFFLHYENEGEAFLHSTVTTDEMWVYHYKSETKCQSVE